jgi:hypothetical protein
MDFEDLKDEQQERMCELCEAHVYGCKMNTNQYNLCEGSKCDIAIEYLIDELNEEKMGRRKYLLLG